MSLTHDEQARLDEIAAHLFSTDPALSSRLDWTAARRRRRRVLAESVTLLLAGMLIMVAGAAAVGTVPFLGLLVVAAGIATMGAALHLARTLNPPEPGYR